MTHRHRLFQRSTRPIHSGWVFLSRLVRAGDGNVPHLAQTPHPPEQLKTDAGEVVRNQSEMMIANYLHRNNVRYRYEAGAPDRDGSFEFTRNPEFYLTDYDVYIESWGVMETGDEETREQYRRMRRWRSAQYHRSNIKVISIYPSNLANLDLVFRNKFKRIAGVELPGKQAAS